MADAIYAGSAPEDAAAWRGWLLGHFMPAGDIRNSADVEIKWGVHPRGDQRAQWVTAEVRTALIVLVSGRFRIDFREQSVVLARQGDYVVFQGVDHSWFAEEDSVIVGVRWPSVPGYAIPEPSQPMSP
ncbi:MAG TPA: signal peptidase I [Streptosporangiaceae bacterium]